ncbi:MAG: HD domain-containing protein, partial [Candidatus Omnitrophica bacterium]|nr:HD domain-containing protein [Candidatus Omnitrophota bacterium]
SDSFFITSYIGLPPSCRNWKFNMQSKLISWLTNEKKTAVRTNFHRKPLSILDFHIIAEMRLLRSAISIPLLYKQEIVGILNLGEKLSGEHYSGQDLELLDTLGTESAIAISNANLYNTLEKNYLQTIQALAQAIEAKDRSTRGHSERVTKLAIEIARELNINRENIETLQYASILHDIGKIAVEEEILNKPGKLTEAEYERIKTHPAKGEEIIAPITFLEKARPIIRHHHERFDGKGYPDQMKGTEIPLLARILSVADVFDALVSDRPYRVFRMSNEEALAEIQKCSGTQFDPDIVQILSQMFASNKITLA